MKKILTAALVVVFLFSVCASASWLWRSGHARQGAPEGTADQGAAAGLEIPSRHPGLGLGKGGAASQPPPRSPFRPPHNPAADEAVQLAASLRERLAAVKEREAQFTVRQKHLDLIAQDIRGERAAVDELRKQISAELQAGEVHMTALEKKHLDLDQQRQKAASQVSEIEKRLIELDGVERKNLDKTAEMFNSMAPESAAKILQQMADTGKLDTAVKLLGQMKERQAAKVLAELPDPALAAQLLDKMKSLKRNTAAPKK